MGIAQIVVDNLLEDDFPSHSDIISRAIKQTRVGQLSKLFGWRFGFEVYASEAGVIEDNASEMGIELTSKSWETLATDIWHIEMNCLSAMKKNDLLPHPEGHEGESLIGSCYFNIGGSSGLKIPSKKSMRMVYLGSGAEYLGTSNGAIWEFIEDQEELWKDVSELGQSLLDVSIHFPNLEGHGAEEAELIEDFYDSSGLDESSKKWLDFNQVVKSTPRTGVYKKVVDGVPIFTAKCPGCKKLHGTFRTFDEASTNKMCQSCNSDLVDMMKKYHENGKIKPLLKKHD